MLKPIPTLNVFMRWLAEHPALDVIYFADIPRGARTFTGPVVTITRVNP